MFALFKKTSELDKLQKRYEKLMKDWHTLSTTNRGESDKKYAEAQKILDQIEILQK
ncbi:Lacal_2735 family protein [uncultured Psychroserpens sp.]|uniref:Lacal_2735 family protein n=1 Tax=uncultured Psychroserpens sp. TaxID=255436 RepID=UPI0026357CBE|nr:Lacal_2735 family protein [uncultured Psychroserpens sp.]